MPNFNSLIAAPGIVAVTIAAPGSPTHTHHGLAVWSPIHSALIALLAEANETELRLQIGEHTVLVQVEAGLVVAVALPTGDAIAKSVRRMIRRCAKSTGETRRRGAQTTTAAPATGAPDQDPLDASKAFS